jgi:hypothetical protein
VERRKGMASRNTSPRNGAEDQSLAVIEGGGTAIQSRSVDDIGSIMESLIAQGDLAKLTPGERVQYYNHLCSSLGLNPITRPFEYIILKGKLTLYARKDATEQLRKMYGISITKMEEEVLEGLYKVKAHARTVDGRMDVSTGVVAIRNLQGEDLANALMKAETKAKRRVTLSICGLGMLDETEVGSIPGAQMIEGEGVEIISSSSSPAPLPAPAPTGGRDGIEEKRVTEDTPKGRVEAWGFFEDHGYKHLTHKVRISREDATRVLAAVRQGRDPKDIPLEEIRTRYREVSRIKNAQDVADYTDGLRMPSQQRAIFAEEDISFTPEAMGLDPDTLQPIEGEVIEG